LLAITQKCETVARTMATTNTKQRKQRAAIFKALGHPARLRIVEVLRGGERCVCDLVDVSEGGWSTVSRHLSVLKSAGILEDEKRGLQVYYKLALPCVGTFLDCLGGDGETVAKPAKPTNNAKSCGCR
jgi:DNA-binding transcriptional ArsR family regulator